MPRTGALSADLAGGVFELLNPQLGERILDLGCGDGALTKRLVEAGASVVGVDSSADMVAAASALGLDARVVAAENLPFDSEFDAVFSNAALHWMHDQDAVLAGVARALKPGGRFVAEMGGHGNIATIEVALRAVFARNGLQAEKLETNYFPTPAAYVSLFERHGFPGGADRVDPAAHGAARERHARLAGDISPGRVGGTSGGDAGSGA